jgi:hypothetical protein
VSVWVEPLGGLCWHAQIPARNLQRSGACKVFDASTTNTDDGTFLSASTSLESFLEGLEKRAHSSPSAKTSSQDPIVGVHELLEQRTGSEELRRDTTVCTSSCEQRTGSEEGSR